MARFIKSFQNDAAIQAAVDDKSLGHPYVALNDATGKIDWNGKDIDYSKMYLTIEALEDGDFNISYMKNSAYYSINNSEWVKKENTNYINLKSGDKVRVKCLQSSGVIQAYGWFWNNTIKFNVYGNVESMFFGDNFEGHNEGYRMAALFRYSTGLVDASNMVMPTSIAMYDEMFNGCTSLTTAPELPATTLVENCYKQMFYDCTKLNHIKCLATDISASNCLNNWVNGVSPTGTFVKKAGVNWPTGASGIPSGWTVIEE